MDAIGNRVCKRDKRLIHVFYIISTCYLLGYTGIPIISGIGTFGVSVLMYIFLWLLFLYIKKRNGSQQIEYSFVIKLYLFWNLLILLRGYWDAVDYWDYKTLIMGRTTALLLPAIMFIGYRLDIILKFYSFLLRTYPIISLFLVNKISYPILGLSFLFAIPWIPWFKSKILILLCSFFIILSIDWDSRAWMLRLAFALLLLFIYHRTSHLLSNFTIKILFLIMLLTPIILVILGRSNQFNVFRMTDYVKNETIKKEDLSDTRSHLYSLVQTKLQKEGKELIGLGGTSEFWENFYSDITRNNKGFNKKGRDHTESGLLNMYLYGGWINAILYSLLFIISSYLAIFKSNSLACKVLGLFIIFRWNISFVDETEGWILSNIMLFSTMGMCISHQFRRLSDNDIKSIIKRL